MEITESTIYWITRLDKFHVTAGVLLGISFMVLLICIVVCCVYKNQLDEIYSKEYRERIKREMKITIKIACYAVFSIAMCASVLVFVPTSREMAMIKVLPAISNSKFMSEELPKDIREVYLMAKDAVKEKLVGEKK